MTSLVFHVLPMAQYAKIHALRFFRFTMVRLSARLL